MTIAFPQRLHLRVPPHARVCTPSAELSSSHPGSLSTWRLHARLYAPPCPLNARVIAIHGHQDLIHLCATQVTLRWRQGSEFYGRKADRPLCGAVELSPRI